MNGSCCACLSVSYDPEKTDQGNRDRWTCNDCGASFVRGALADYWNQVSVDDIAVMRHKLVAQKTINERLSAENSDLQLDKAHLLCAMNSIAASTCCDKCNEAKMVAVKCIEDLAAVSAEPCPDLGKDGHNHPANPCPKCEGRGTVEQGQSDD